MIDDHLTALRRARFLTLRVLRAIERLAGQDPAPAGIQAAAALGTLLHRIAVAYEFPEERRLLRAWSGHGAQAQGLQQDHEATRHLAVSLCTVPEGALRDPRIHRLIGRAARALLLVDNLLDELEFAWAGLSPGLRRKLRPCGGLRAEQLESWAQELDALERLVASPPQDGASSLSISRSRRYR